MKLKYSNLCEICSIIAANTVHQQLLQINRDERLVRWRLDIATSVDELIPRPFGLIKHETILVTEGDVQIYREILQIKPLIVGTIYFNTFYKEISYKVFNQDGQILISQNLEIFNYKFLLEKGQAQIIGKRLLHQHKDVFLIGCWLHYPKTKPKMRKDDMIQFFLSNNRKNSKNIKNLFRMMKKETLKVSEEKNKMWEFANAKAKYKLLGVDLN